MSTLITCHYYASLENVGIFLLFCLDNVNSSMIIIMIYLITWIWLLVDRNIFLSPSRVHFSLEDFFNHLKLKVSKVGVVGDVSSGRGPFNFYQYSHASYLCNMIHGILIALFLVGKTKQNIKSWKLIIQLYLCYTRHTFMHMVYKQYCTGSVVFC